MRSIPAKALAFLGALALLGLSLGCGSQESVSQRRRRQIELVKGTSLDEQALAEEKEGIPEPKATEGGIGQAPESDELALLSQEKNIDAAQESVRVAELNYGEGLITITDLGAAQVALSEARINYLRAIYDYALSLAQMQKAIGLGWKEPESN